MNMTKSEFFKRKNRDKIYQIYKDVIYSAYEFSDKYYDCLNQIKAFKDKYRMNNYIWEMLDRVELDCSSNYEMDAYCRCQQLKEKAFYVNTVQYDVAQIDIVKFTKAIGKMEQLIDLITYLEDNELGVRSK